MVLHPAEWAERRRRLTPWLWGVLLVGLVVIGWSFGREQRPAVKPPLTPTKIIQLYYYNPKLDLDEAGNVQCSSAGLVQVSRTVSSSTDIIADVIRLLLRGQLTQTELSSGITTEFPLSGVTLDKTELVDGVLNLTFSDSLNRIGGGSCRVNILRAQIEATAKQFPGVVEVKFQPEELFQP